MKPFKTLVDVIHYIAEQKNPKALNHLENEQWKAFSSSDFVTSVKYLTLYLNTLQFNRGERIGIMAPCSAFWTIADFAILLAGGISVPLFANISHENFEYEVDQAEIKVLFISGEEQWKMLHAHQGHFKQIIAFDEKPNALTLSEAYRIGKEIDAKDPDLYPSLLSKMTEKDVATIIFTSGSTGLPKGVELTQTSLVSLLHIDPFYWNPKTDRYLSVLPLAHIFARALNLIMVAWGISVYYLADVKKLGEAAQQVKPSLMILVPRILEKIQANMWAKVNAGNFMTRLIGRWALRLAAQKESSFWRQIFHPIADTLVYSRLREAFGNRLRLIISGGAHLNPDVYHFFLAIGFPVYEGYGLTEAATVSCNRFNRIKVGTIGLPFEGMTVSLSPEGELLVKGGLVMKGYYKSPEATQNAFTEDGWLRTGDRAQIDEEGFITILGRLKELFKTTKGEYISPVPIEQALAKDRLVDMAIIIADSRKYATCLIFPDFEAIKKIQKKLNKEQIPMEEFLQGPEIKQHMYKLLVSINKHLNHWEELHDFRVVAEHPSIEGGELTPTMKLRREVIEKKYEDLINSMYFEELV